MPKGFLVRHALMDMVFVKFKELVFLVEVNTTAAREHLAVVEQKICHVKERVQAMTSKYPFRWIPVIVLVHAVYFCAFWLNAFQNWTENVFSWEIVTGLTTDYARDCKVDLGLYVEASVDVTVTNNNSEWTTSCVALRPAGNCQESVKCFDI